MKRTTKNTLAYTELPAIRILGVRLNKLTMSEVLEIATHNIESRRQLLLGVVNVAKIVNAQKHPELRVALDEADLVLADGLPIIWLSQLLGDALPERVAGIDIMYKLLQQANEKHYRVYFLGAKPEVLQKVIITVQKDYPGVRIAGYRDGYFSKDQEQSVAEGIRNSQADILFVAISSPKKENFLREWRTFIKIPVCHGVGGSFDILACVSKRAPLWMQKCGLEWLYRLIQEPQRMWRRYLVTNTIFTKLSLGAILRARFARLFHRFGLIPGLATKKQDRQLPEHSGFSSK
jgi:N-acetylglucosaminyldiphosphoundecaprenol N-acetyl-beta-D-mannosaminyltransferase